MKFVDTNVLLYAISQDPSEHRKTETALEVISSPIEEIGLSVQVLQEFYVQATRKSRGRALSPRLAAEYVNHWQACRVQDNTLELLRAAMASSERFGLSYWDAAIIEAARIMGCDTVLSEDLGDGQSYGGVRVRNPFRKSPSPRLR